MIESRPIGDVDFEWLEKVVRHAGEIALRHFRKVKATRKADNTVVTAADGEVEAFLRDALSQAFPADGFLGEETGGDAGRSGRTWVIDPIDGTAAYAIGLPVWGVSVGLIQDRQPVAGLFYMPLVNELYLSHGGDASFDGQPMRVDDSGQVDSESSLLVTSEAHRNFRIDFVGKTRALGSAAAHVCYVARGTAVAALLHRFSIWDIAAALPILRAAGGDLRYLSGKALDPAELADGRKCSEPVLAGAPWALEYFARRIEDVGRGA
jgi:myo-inositol-1(or 4)-monophosphatase